MPHITVETSVKLAPEVKQRLAGELNAHISLIPGKVADKLMIAVVDGVFMSFGERKGEDFVHMDILMYLSASKADKDKLVAKYTEIVGSVIGVKPGNVYITIQELAHWGVGGMYK